MMCCVAFEHFEQFFLKIHFFALYFHVTLGHWVCFEHFGGGVLVLVHLTCVTYVTYAGNAAMTWTGVWHVAMCCSRLLLAAPVGGWPFAALPLDPFPL